MRRVAHDLVVLLNDDDRIRAERANRSLWEKRYEISEQSSSAVISSRNYPRWGDVRGRLGGAGKPITSREDACVYDPHPENDNKGKSRTSPVRRVRAPVEVDGTSAREERPESLQSESHSSHLSQQMPGAWDAGPQQLEHSLEISEDFKAALVGANAEVTTTAGTSSATEFRPAAASTFDGRRTLLAPELEGLETGDQSRDNHVVLSGAADIAPPERVPNSRIALSNTTAENVLATRLNTYFAPEKLLRRKQFTDADINEISAILKHQTSRWSKVPRTYVILRVIGHLDLLDSCIDIGFSDYWFPVTERNLPDVLRQSIRTAFVEAQQMVMTQSMNLEKGDRGEHCYFRKGDTLPLETREVLGRGGFGQVDRVLSLISFKEYARKRVLRSSAFRGRKKEDIKQFIAEIEILKRLKHHHVVEFVGSYTDAKYIGLIMTPIADGDLTSYLSVATSSKHPELRTFFGCLATALEFLHDHNVRHKDIKPQNILVSSGKVLFADFGLSFDFTDATGSTTMSMVNGMTPRYCAPEVANHEARNKLSDIWSLGVVFLEMTATLKGKNLQYMDEFLREHGTEQTFVRLNVAALPELFSQLAQFGEWTDNKPLDWTVSMLSVELKMRPTAAALVNQITAPIRNGESTGFCGICCAITEEEDFSDLSSDLEVQ